MPTISIQSATATEGDYLAFNVTLSEPTFDAVTLNYEVLTGTAGDDDLYYDRTSHNYRNTLTLAPGETSGTIFVRTSGDTLDERDESLVLRLTEPSENADFEGGGDELRVTGVILDNDGTGSNQALLVSDAVVVEGDAGTKEAVFELRLTRPATESYTVGYATRDIDAEAGQDYDFRSGSVTFAPGEEVKIVRVPVLSDTAPEAAERFALVVTPPDALPTDTEGLAGEGVILDDDTAPQPSVSVSPESAVEGEYLAFTVTLSEPTFDAVTLNYEVLTGTAGDNDLYYDRTSASYRGTLTLAPGETSGTIFVRTSGDTLDERDESLVLRLSGLSENASFAGGGDELRATGVILDNDGTGSNQVLVVSDAVVLEGDAGTKEAVFELRLSQPASETFSVSYVTRDIGAVAGEDYIAQSGSVSFAPGEQVRTVRVPIIGDTAPEGTESFSLVVTPPAGLGDTAGLAGEGVIRDDDTAPQPSVSISPDSAVEGDHLAFTVTLSQPTFDAVTVNYEVLTGTAGDDDLYSQRTSSSYRGTLTFAAGETSGTIFVRTSGDTLDERDESLVLRLSGLSENASFAGGGDELRATGVILDNDGAGSNQVLLVSDAVVLEGDDGQREAVFELRLSQPASEAFSVSYATRDIGAVAGEDYIAQSGSVSFAPGEEVQIVRVPIIGDTAPEGTESFSLVVTPPPELGDPAGLAGEGVIRDDDTAPQPSVSISPDSAVEGDYLAFTVTLSEASTDAVSVDWRVLAHSAEESDLFYSLAQNQGTLTFGIGQTSQTIFVRTRGDSTDERDEAVHLELSDPVNASLADGTDRLQTVGFIFDNDGAGSNRSASIAPIATREHAAESFVYEIPVLLSRPAAETLSFSVSAESGSATEGVDFRLLDNRISFGAGETLGAVSVEIFGDDQVEGIESFLLSLDPLPGVPYAGTVTDTVITIAPGPLMPGPGDDDRTGTVGDDSINMLGGDDIYRGLEGNDTVLGGAGRDTLIGDAGADYLNGQGGDDLLIGGSTEDVSASTGATVYRLYQATLDRAPDTGGFDNWTGRLEAGSVTLLEAIGGFVDSPEFQATYGALDNEAFVTLLYNNVLDRAPDAQGLENWTGRLDDGMAREEVVRGFAQSAEFQENTNAGASAYVLGSLDLEGGADDMYRLYQATLDRAPDLQGLTNWSSRLATGTDYLDVAQGFMGSPEFQGTYGALDNGAFVTLLYNNVLDRAPDDRGLENWTGRLDDGMSRAEVVRGFAQGAEFISATALPFRAYMEATGGDTFDGGPGDDILFGSFLADRFVFELADKGQDRVIQLNPWDEVVFSGFGYADADAARANLHAQGNDVVFSDRGVSVIFMHSTLEEFDALTLTV